MAKRKAKRSADKPLKHFQVMQTSQEASWLSFNRRVLEQTRRPDFPLLERLRFLSIWASNNDEFYAARVSRIFAEGRDSEEYTRILQEAFAQSEEANQIYRDFLRELERLSVHILEPAQLTKPELQFFGAYLAEEVAPRTDLLETDSLRDLNSEALYFAAGEGLLQHLIRLPEGLPRLLPIPGRVGSFVRLGALVRVRSDLFLPTKQKLPLYEFRLLRLASLQRSRADWDELPEALESRLDGQVSHLELEEDFPQLWGETIRTVFDLTPTEVFRLSPPLDLTFVGTIVSSGKPSELFVPLKPLKPKGFAQKPFAYLTQRDLVLYHPFDDYSSVEAFALEAANDPKVEMMRATLYRIGRSNGIAEALMQAARNGKDAAVLLEGRARFDELSNLEWSLRFAGAGVRVLPLPSKKVHAKALFVRRGSEQFVHLGTGNYNPINGRLYTDLSLFTAEPSITRDVGAFFSALERKRTPALDILRTASSIRDSLIENIKAEAHKKGHIIFKFNHITDTAVLQALEEAMLKGAKVELIVRSTLTSLWTGMHIKSIVGRYLEHARIAAFKAKGKWNVWASSADVMPRNLDGRFELFFPILDSKSKRKVLDILQAQLEDDRNTYLIKPSGQEARWGGKKDGQKF